MMSLIVFESGNFLGLILDMGGRKIGHINAKREKIIKHKKLIFTQNTESRIN
jgi:hypothetical protein